MAKTPEQIAKYQITEHLASGGMGTVYKAIHPTLQRNVIIKKLTLRGKPDFAERFRREAKILMDFRHENIVDVYDHFKEGRSHYIVMEYVDGISLEALIRRERYLPEELAFYILWQLCDALRYAHERGVIHRDIKPANILINREGSVKLVDFGIASSREDQENLTRDGMTLGSPSYMAPEQFENSRTVDARADIYSLGVLLYESLTGKKPYPGGFSADLLAAISKGSYCPPEKYNPALSSFARSIISVCMQPKAKRRCQNLGRLKKRIERRVIGTGRPDLKKQLSEAVCSGEIVPLSTRRKSSFFSFLRAGILFITVCSLLCALFYTSGWYHRLLLGDTYGELELQVRMDEGYKEPDDYYLRAWIFREAGDDGEDFGAEPFRFAQESAGDYGQLLFTSSQRFFPRGTYRIKVQVEGTVYWRTLNLDSYREKKGKKVLLFPGAMPRPLPLDVDFFVQDAKTWEDIGDICDISILKQGRWLPWSEELGDQLTSGNIYRFRFSAPGYKTKEFSLLIQYDQHKLHINPKLQAVEGEEE